MSNKVLFLRIVDDHFAALRLQSGVERERLYYCQSCGLQVPLGPEVQRRLMTQGKTTVRCLGCDASVSLVDLIEEYFGDPSLIAHSKQILQGKHAQSPVASAKTFDVFLAHNSDDKDEIEVIATHLLKKGLKPWFDHWHLPPGRLFQAELERVLPSVHAIAVFVGESGVGPWEALEIRAAISQFVKRHLPVIPVLLPGAPQVPELPLLLQEFSWVRFSASVDDTEALAALEWGITGNPPSRELALGG
jgi:hypothetical protein